MNYVKDSVTEVLSGSYSKNEVADIAVAPRPPNAFDKPLVLIIDDMTIERECLAKALSARQPGFEVITRGSRAEYRFGARPDIVLVSADAVDDGGRALPDLIGIVQGALSNVPIVVLAEDAESVTETANLFDLGVSGCLSYTDGIEGLTQVLSLVLHGGACFPRGSICHKREAIRGVADPEPGRPSVPTYEHVDSKPFHDTSLTARERDVVQQLRRGKPNKIIAYELGISISTVKVHVRNIMRKTGATNRVEAALLPECLGQGPE